MRIDIITGETNSPYGTDIRNTNLLTQFTLEGVVRVVRRICLSSDDFCSDRSLLQS
jgi:hypothetical protein